MARNLMKAGNDLVVFDVNEAVVSNFRSAGAKAGKTPKEVASQADVLITMLPSSPHVKSVYSGADGVVKAAKPGTLFLDCSTIDPTTAREMAKLAEENNITALDAPVSGGVGGAEAGTLTFMVGGSKEGFEKAQAILKVMGKNIVHCGPNGTGQVAKICNNMLLAIGMIGTAETMNLGVRLGMDPKVLAGIINTSSGRSWSSDTYNPCPGVMENVPASRGYSGGFGTPLMSKDLGLAMTAAKDSGSAVHLGALADKIYNDMKNDDNFKGLDFSSVYKWLANQLK